MTKTQSKITKIKMKANSKYYWTNNTNIKNILIKV